MMNFIVFFLSFLSNLVLIKAIPNEIIGRYINIYTVVGGLSALAFFILFSNANFKKYIRTIAALILACYLFISLTADGFWTSVFIYPMLLVCNDYLSTQSGLDRWRTVYRGFLIVSVLPLLLLHEDFEIIFQGRVLLLAVVLLYYVTMAKEVTALHVNSTWKYIFFNYTFYYGPLLWIANIPMTPVALKTWYVFAQGGLVVYLKYLDFALRKDHTVSRHLGLLVLLCSSGAPLWPGWWFPSTAGLVAYFTGLMGLVYSKRFINIKES